MEGFDLSTISDVYVGSIQYSEIYYGSNKVWPTGVLPYDMELEYLQADGTQYINTGIINNSSVIIDMKMSASGTNCLHGSEYTYQYRFKWGADGNGYVYYGYQNNHTSGVTFQLDQPCTYYLKQGEQYVKDYQENTILSSSETLSTYSTNPIMLFKCYSGSDWVNTSGTVRIYRCKIYNNGVLMDLIPVRKGQIGYLYDKISGQLFANAGTGDFVLGPDIIEPDIIEIESLGCTGSQYIDTGINLSQYPIKLDTEVCFTNTSGELSLYGNNRNGLNGNTVLSAGQYNGKFFMWGGTTSWQLEGTCSINTWYNVQFECQTDSSRELTINGVHYTSNASNGYAINNPNTFYLFFNGQNHSAKLIGDVKYVKLYIGDVLVRDYIPVRVGQVGYMYDKVSGQLYGNNGTGSFTLGPDKPHK